jgi:hypothetical protein
VFRQLCTAVLRMAPGSLSSKSARGGYYAASAYLDRISPLEINEGGGWSYSSRTPIKYYILASIRPVEPQSMVPSNLHLPGWLGSNWRVSRTRSEPSSSPHCRHLRT